MTRTADIVYRKTALGQAELAQRRGELPPRARSVLVMVNGLDSASRLVERLGVEVLDLLAVLRQQGLIEAMAGSERGSSSGASASRTAASASKAAAVAPAPTAPAATASAPPAAPAPAVVDVEAMRRAAQALVQLLLPFFGPDAPRIARTALMAQSAAEFNRGLDEIVDRLAIHLGKRKAAEAVAALRQRV